MLILTFSWTAAAVFYATSISSCAGHNTPHALEVRCEDACFHEHVSQHSQVTDAHHSQKSNHPPSNHSSSNHNKNVIIFRCGDNPYTMDYLNHVKEYVPTASRKSKNYSPHSRDLSACPSGDTCRLYPVFHSDVQDEPGSNVRDFMLRNQENEVLGVYRMRDDQLTACQAFLRPRPKLAKRRFSRLKNNRIPIDPDSDSDSDDD